MGKSKLFIVLFLVWACFTGLTGLSSYRGIALFGRFLGFNFHPRWAIISFIFMGSLCFFCIRNFQIKKSGDHELITFFYSFLLGASGSLLTGIAVDMHFLPLFIHQIVVWPWIIYFIGTSIRRVFAF